MALEDILLQPHVLVKQYTADVDGKPAIIGRDKGRGFTIRLESKPGWDMINHYDEDGDFEGTTFEKQDKEEE